MRFTRRPPFKTYSPGRRDARLGEARAMLSIRRSLDGLEAHSLACLFNLRDATAQLLIDEERARRG